jgi:hypothetical protein
LRGQVRALGDTATVVDRYVRDAFVATSEDHDQSIHIRSAMIESASGLPIAGPVAPGTALCFKVEFETSNPIQDLNFAFRVLRSTDQLIAYDGHFSQSDLGIPSDRPCSFTVSYHFHANLTRGQYYFDVFAQDRPTQRFLARLTPAGHLTVVENRTWGGVADLNVRPEVGVTSLLTQ